MKNNFTLLYVEDEKIVRENFAEVFQNYFQNVITAEDGIEAWNIYQENSIDAAILDISLPKMDGLSLAKKIREKNENIEIIMLTGHTEKDKLLKAINMHLFSYLVKPVKKEAVDENLQNLINKLTDKTNIHLKNNYTFNLSTQTLYYKSIPNRLSKHETKLVDFLVRNLNNYFSACDISNALFDAVWVHDETCNNLIQLVSRFKKKMLDLHQTEHFFIENIYGMGYTIQKA